MRILSPGSKYGFLFIVLLLCIVMFGAQWLTYEVGYRSGYRKAAAIPTELVVMQSDEKAMKTLTDFLARANSGQADLKDLIVHHDTHLDWIGDEKLKKNMLWELLRKCVVGDDAVVHAGQELVLKELRGDDREKWAVRAEEWRGKLMAWHRDDAGMALCEEMLGYYQSVQDRANVLRLLEMKRRSLMGKQRYKEADDVLTQWVKWSGQGGKDDYAARIRMLVGDGRLLRLQGQEERAKACFDQAAKLSERAGSQAVHEGEVAVLLAEKELELGRHDEAKRLFAGSRTSLQGRAEGRADLLVVLRGLAQLSRGENAFIEALGFLYEAEGVAAGFVDANQSFWPCLYDQRGWVLLDQGEFALALNDFNRSMQYGKKYATYPQSLEGACRAYLALGNTDEAEQCALQACREREAVSDNYADRARVYELLGNVYDVKRDAPAALDAYTKSLDALNYAHVPDNHPSHLHAGLCKAYVLSEMNRMQDAADMFERIIPHLQGDKRVETLKSLAACYDALNRPEKGDECWAAAGFPRVRKPAVKTRTADGKAVEPPRR